MKRFFLDELLSWRDNPERRPLIISGARQVGKSYVVGTLFAPYFENFVEVNFEFDPGFSRCFTGERLDPVEIIQRLELYTSKKIEPGKTLLFLDEAQRCEAALASLRYFYEQLPALHVIAAGSLIEFALEKISMPVGRVTTRHLTPLSFEEYLINSGNEKLYQTLRDSDLTKPFDAVIHAKGNSLVKEYSAIGGMPSAVQSFLTHRDYLRVEALHQDLLDGYRLDFPKYTTLRSELQSVPVVFEQAPRFVCKQFAFSHISRELRAEYLRSAIDLLVKANIFDLIYSSHGYPLTSNYEPGRYKLLFLDVGLLNRASGVPLKDVVLRDPDQLINSGQIAEQLVGQMILAQAGYRREKLFYWERHKAGADAEVDYLIQRHGQSIPIEVKAGAFGKLKSMRYYLSVYSHTPCGVKVSVDTIAQAELNHQKLLSIPLYAWPAWLSKK